MLHREAQRALERHWGAASLLTYQREGVAWMLDRELGETPEGVPVAAPACRGGILADEMGLGKTVQMAAVITANLKPTTLVLVPKSLVRQWVAELRAFTRVSARAVTSSEARRPDFDPSAWRVTVASYGALRPGSKLVTHIWDRVVLDEAHLIKNHRAARSVLSRVLHARLRWVLTATPVNRRRDAATLLDFVSGPAYGTMADARCALDSPEWPALFLRRTKSRGGVAACDPARDVTCGAAALPPLEMVTVAVDLSAPERTAYEDLRLSSVTARDTRDAALMLTLLLRRRQFAAHPRVADLGYDGPAAKLDALLALFRAHAAGTRSLVFCHWHAEMREVAAALREFGPVAKFHGGMSSDLRDRAVRDFMHGTAVTMVLQIDAGGLGLNLQRASRVYVYSPHWNAVNEMQAIARAHRVGTAHPVRVTRLVAARTVEEGMHAIQRAKLGDAAAVLGDARLLTQLGSAAVLDALDPIACM